MELRPLSDFVEYQNKFITINDNQEYTLVTTKLHRKGVVLRKITKGIEIKTKKQQVIKAGQLLVAEIDAKVGGYGIVPKELEGAIVSSHYFLFNINGEKLLQDYLGYILKTDEFFSQIKAQGSTNYAAIRPRDILKIAVPYCDIEQQRRVAEKLYRITQHSNRLNNNLTKERDYLFKLRQAILQEAVSGKLVSQDPNDGTATRLQENIAIHKRKLSKKNSNCLNLGDQTQKTSFKLPRNWATARLYEISDVVRGGSPRPAGSKEFYDGDIPFLKVADLTADDNMYLRSYTSTIKPAGLQKTRFVKANTLLLTNSGATLGVPKICTFDTTFNDGIAAFLNLPDFIDPRYLYLFLKSKTNWFLETASRGQGQPNLNTILIGGTLLPIPPLKEQHLIVEKVCKLMADCNKLELKIKDNKINTDLMIETILKETFTR